MKKLSNSGDEYVSDRTKWPALTSEEVYELIQFDKDFINKYEHYGIRQEYRIARVLGNLAAYKLHGTAGYAKNITEAREHMRKAELYNGGISYYYSMFGEKLKMPASPKIFRNKGLRLIKVWPNSEKGLTEEGLRNRRTSWEELGKLLKRDSSKY